MLGYWVKADETIDVVDASPITAAGKIGKTELRVVSEGGGWHDLLTWTQALCFRRPRPP
jgi:hypothetical protein